MYIREATNSMNRFLQILISATSALADVYGWTKVFLIVSFTSIANFYAPIFNFLYVIAVWATIDIVAGVLADHGRWIKRKFRRAFTLLIIYFTIIFLAYWTGIMMQESRESILTFSSWISWVMIYYYVGNTLRNLNIRFPDSKTIAFLYWVVTVKFISKISFLEDFYNSKQNKNMNP